jgi:hypothetical protein
VPDLLPSGTNYLLVPTDHALALPSGASAKVGRPLKERWDVSTVISLLELLVILVAADKIKPTLKI